MNNQKNWKVLSNLRTKNTKDIIKVLLKNRGLRSSKEIKEFFEPPSPLSISLKSLGINVTEVKKAINRVKKAKDNDEHVIVYGDYDADGITGTATMWEALHSLGIHVLPYIPNRFSEGYGLNIESIKNLIQKDPKLKLIITVDHGIVAAKKVDQLKKLGIDTIITDHHQAGKTKPKPASLIYTTQIGGSAVSWILAREIASKFHIPSSRFNIQERLQLAAIGTVADQLPLVGPNRSIVKYGLEELNKTTRPGLVELFLESKITKGQIGTYEVGFIIAPRINSTGRLTHGLESLRLLCTKDKTKASEIAKSIAKTNKERQKIVDSVMLHAKNSFSKVTGDSVIILFHESYHEGVIGLAASRLTEVFYRPSIVISTKNQVAKASARSIPGFNIIQAIRKFDHLYKEGGGHDMAAGFSIDIKNITKFNTEINEYAKKLLTPEILTKSIKIDLEIPFALITTDLYKAIYVLEPVGIGNPAPIFISTQVELVEFRLVGSDSKHLKLKLRQGGYIFDSIFFGGGEIYPKLKPNTVVDVVYKLEQNLWNGRVSLQLFVKDLRID